MIWREAPLETVLCVVDATTTAEALNDALLRSQLRAADVVALSKVDLVDAAGRARCAMSSGRLRPAAVVVDALHGEVPAALLFPVDVDRVPAPREVGPRRPAADRFETLSWTSERPVSLPRLQQAIGRLAPKLARAKGLFETVEQPGRLTVFQLAGGRATLAPGGSAGCGHWRPGAADTDRLHCRDRRSLARRDRQGHGSVRRSREATVGRISERNPRSSLSASASGVYHRARIRATRSLTCPTELRDRDDLQFLTGRTDDIADSLAHQRPRHRGYKGNGAGLRVGLVLSDDAIFLHAPVVTTESHRAAEGDGVG